MTRTRRIAFMGPSVSDLYTPIPRLRPEVTPGTMVPPSRRLRADRAYPI